MTRRCLLALGSYCVLVLGACGSKFSAGNGTGGVSGALGGGGASVAGSGAGDASGARSGDDSAGDAGAESGGAFAAAGSPPDDGDAGAGGAGVGGAGAGGGPVIGRGGSSGSAGAGGGVEPPVIPQLGLALWLRADVGVQQANGLVQGWLDQSGNQANAAQTGLSLSPEFLAKGLNDLPALKFDGVRQYLRLPKGFSDFSRGLAGFMVLQPLASECTSVLELSNGSEVDDIALGMWQNKWTYEVEVPYLQNGNVDLLAPSLYAANHLPTAGLVNATADLRINGALLQTLEMPVPKAIVREDNFVGHTEYGSCNYFKGTVSEIILYQRVVTANEVRSIESYLRQHWDLGPAAP